MRKRYGPPISKLMLVFALTSGCCMERSRFEFCPSDVCHVPTEVTTWGPQQVRLASAHLSNACGTGIAESFSPYDLDEDALAAGNLVSLTLQECVQLALGSSKIIRDLGGTILRTPQIATSTLEPAELDVVLETHRRLLDARLRFHQSQVEYALSLRNVHFEKGTLLQYNNVFLAESVTPAKAQQDAAERIQYQDPSVEPAVRDILLTR